MAQRWSQPCPALSLTHMPVPVHPLSTDVGCAVRHTWVCQCRWAWHAVARRQMCVACPLICPWCGEGRRLPPCSIRMITCVLSVEVVVAMWNRVIINTLRPRQNGRHFADDIFKCIFLNENVWIPIKISLKFVPKGPINNIPALVQIMAWRRPGDKPLSEPMMASMS